MLCPYVYGSNSEFEKVLIMVLENDEKWLIFQKRNERAIQLSLDALFGSFSFRVICTEQVLNTFYLTNSCIVFDRSTCSKRSKESLFSWKKKNFVVNLLNFCAFHHVFISSLDMFKNCNNSYHIESEQVQTCLNMFRHV